MVGGAVCAVSCRSGILAKSSCSATPMAKARTTIFPSLAPHKENTIRDRERDTGRERGEKENRDAKDREIEHKEGVVQGERRKERSFHVKNLDRNQRGGGTIKRPHESNRENGQRGEI